MSLALNQELVKGVPTDLVKSSSASMWRGTGEYLEGVAWGGGYTGLGSMAPM